MATNSALVKDISRHLHETAVMIVPVSRETMRDLIVTIRMKELLKAVMRTNPAERWKATTAACEYRALLRSMWSDYRQFMRHATRKETEK